MVRKWPGSYSACSLDNAIKTCILVNNTWSRNVVFFWLSIFLLFLCYYFLHCSCFRTWSCILSLFLLLFYCSYFCSLVLAFVLLFLLLFYRSCFCSIVLAFVLSFLLFFSCSCCCFIVLAFVLLFLLFLFLFLLLFLFCYCFCFYFFLFLLVFFLCCCCFWYSSCAFSCHSSFLSSLFLLLVISVLAFVVVDP